MSRAYAVKDILSSRIDRAQHWSYIEWKAKRQDNNIFHQKSWEPLLNLKGCLKELDRFTRDICDDVCSKCQNLKGFL